jgi:hypothetical protein
MIDYYRRNTRPLTWTKVAVVCTAGAACWWLLYRLAVAGARWAGWV